MYNVHWTLLGFRIMITWPRLSIKRQYRPKVYLFIHKGQYYWDFKRSFEADLVNAYKGNDVFGPFDTIGAARRDCISGCLAHQYLRPKDVLFCGELSLISDKWRALYGSWRDLCRDTSHCHAAED